MFHKFHFYKYLTLDIADTIMSGRSTPINRFKLRSKVISDKEKLENYKDKLDVMIEKHEAKAEAISRHLITNKLLNDKITDTKDLKELVKMGKKIFLNTDSMAEKSSIRNLKEIETVTNVKVVEVTNRLSKITDKENCVNEMTVQLMVDEEDFPEVVIDMKMITIEPVISTELPRIKTLTVDVIGVDIDSDLEEAIQYCEKKLEPQLLTRLVKEYLPLYSARMTIIDNLDPTYCSLKSNNIIEFSNSGGHVLAHLCFMIQFSRSSLGWVQVWRCRLTEAGAEACRRLHVPNELKTEEHVAGWDWAQALDTIGKVAKFDIDTPTKVNDVYLN